MPILKGLKIDDCLRFVICGKNDKQIAGKLAFPLLNENVTFSFVNDNEIEIDCNCGMAKLRIVYDLVNNIENYSFIWKTTEIDYVLNKICLESSYWYGGAESSHQKWPINSMQMPMSPYRTSDIFKGPYGSVQERVWINSNGFAVIVSPKCPLWVAWNKSNDGQLQIMGKFEDKSNSSSSNVILEYKIWVASCLKQLCTEIRKFEFEKLLGFPDESLFLRPIYSTWACYKQDINEQKLLDMSSKIIEHHFPIGQLEIDDRWESKYGDFEFDLSKFSDASKMIAKLKLDGFSVSVWIHPFVNLDSKSAINPDLKKYLVHNSQGQIAISNWWNGDAFVYDFTFEETQEFYLSIMKQFQTKTGVSSFKFDAGEVNYLPSDCILHSHGFCNEYSKRYVEMAAQFGGKIEVRIGCGTQHFPVFVRIADKDSNWGCDNGLKTLIPSVLLLSLLGYPFIIPDMVGGNNYQNKPLDKELYIRWVEASLLLPSIQFSIMPWHFGDSDEVVTIVRNLLQFRSDCFGDTILSLAKQCESSGEPIIRPIWWLLDYSDDALSCDSEFLLGNQTLVAPILEPHATSRMIYLPRGKWISKIDNTCHFGPCWIEQFVPLEKLAIFELTL